MLSHAISGRNANPPTRSSCPSPPSPQQFIRPFLLIVLPQSGFLSTHPCRRSFVSCHWSRKPSPATLVDLSPRNSTETKLSQGSPCQARHQRSRTSTRLSLRTWPPFSLMRSQKNKTRLVKLSRATSTALSKPTVTLPPAKVAIIMSPPLRPPLVLQPFTQSLLHQLSVVWDPLEQGLRLQPPQV